MGIDITKCVSFSGYRLSKMRRSVLEQGSDMASVEAQLVKAIGVLIGRGYTTFIVGGADGFDMMAARIIMELKQRRELEMVVAIPFLGQQRGYSPEDSELYEQILDRADKVEYISHYYHTGAYLERNDYMLRYSSVLVCFYDGLRGGTMYTYNRAKRCGHEIINLAPHAPKVELEATLF